MVAKHCNICDGVEDSTSDDKRLVSGLVKMHGTMLREL